MTTRREIVTKCGAGLAAIIAAGRAPAALVRSMVGARNAIASGAKWKNPYVTDGLIAMWDGEWNELGTDSVWYPCVGNIAFSATNCTRETYGYKTYRSTSISEIRTAAMFTPEQCRAIDIVVAVDGKSVNSAGAALFSNACGMVRYTTDYTQLRLDTLSGALVGSIDFGEVFRLSLRANPEKARKNLGSWVSGVKNSYADGPIISGSWATDIPRSNNGRIFSIRVYNRIPTDAEDAANYAVDKVRFNLP